MVSFLFLVANVFAGHRVIIVAPSLMSTSISPSYGNREPKASINLLSVLSFKVKLPSGGCETKFCRSWPNACRIAPCSYERCSKCHDLRNVGKLNFSLVCGPHARVLSNCGQVGFELRRQNSRQRAVAERSRATVQACSAGAEQCPENSLLHPAGLARSKAARSRASPYRDEPLRIVRLRPRCGGAPKAARVTPGKILTSTIRTQYPNVSLAHTHKDCSVRKTCYIF